MKGSNMMGRKGIIGIVVAIVLVIVLILVLRNFGGSSDKSVGFDCVEPENVPVQINEILPNYRMKEKALVCKVEDEIYVVVTRGEKSSSGFDLEIKKISMNNEEGAKNLKVVAEFVDPKPGDVTTQILTYPYKVVKTELEELPDKVTLEKEYKN